MSSLADNIRKAAQEKNAENMPQGGQTAATQTQMGVAATGKGQSKAQSLKQSNIQEQLGMLEARSQQDRVRQTGMKAAQKVAASEAKMEMDQKQVESANRMKEYEQESLMADQMDKMLSKIEFSEAKLDDRKDAMQLEQVTMNLRLQDRKYRHEIEMVGKQHRLHEMDRLKREATRVYIGEKKSMMYDELNHQYQKATKSREKLWERAQVDLNTALRTAEATIENQTKKAMIETVRDIGTTAYDAWDKGGSWGESEEYRTEKSELTLAEERDEYMSNITEESQKRYNDPEYREFDDWANENLPDNQSVGTPDFDHVVTPHNPTDRTGLFYEEGDDPFNTEVPSDQFSSEPKDDPLW